MADQQVNIQINTQANTQGAAQAVDSLKRVEGATAATGEQAKVAAEKGQKLNLAMEGLARISPTAAAAVNLLRMAMNPMAVAIGLGAAAIAGLQKAWEAWHRVINTSELSRIPNLFERMAAAQQVAEDSTVSLANKLKDLQDATEREKSSFEGMLGALSDYARQADAVAAKRKELEVGRVEADVASGRISAEEGQRRKAGIETAFVKEGGAARVRALQAELNLTEEGAAKAKQEKLAALGQYQVEADKLAGMVTPEDAAASLKKRKEELAAVVARMAAVQGTINKDLGRYGVTNPANYRELSDLDNLSTSMIGEVKRLEDPSIRIDYRRQQALVGRLEAQANAAGSREASLEGKLPGLRRNLAGQQELNGLSAQVAEVNAGAVGAATTRAEQERFNQAVNVASQEATKVGTGKVQTEAVVMLAEALRLQAARQEAQAAKALAVAQQALERARYGRE